MRSSTAEEIPISYNVTSSSGKVGEYLVDLSVGAFFDRERTAERIPGCAVPRNVRAGSAIGGRSLDIIDVARHLTGAGSFEASATEPL